MSKLWRAPLALSLGVALPLLASDPVSAGVDECKPAPGGPPSPALPWAQTRLGFEKAQQLATGAGVTVAVIDSGIAQREGVGDHGNPQSSGIETRSPFNVLTGAGYDSRDTRDCQYHGAMVSSIIAAPPLEGVGFVGLAPDVVIVPIKALDADDDEADTAETLAAAIDYAVGADVDVINISIENDSGVAADTLRPAMDRALEQDVVIVASSGNEDGDSTGNPKYPAAFAEDYPNVLSVGAVDSTDTLATSSTRGGVSVVAPGVGIVAPGAITGYLTQDGTSFAAPFVSATAALVRERFPRLSAAEVVNRIKATADRPGVTVPDAGYGYGVVNPYLALTAVRDDSRVVPKERPPAPVSAPDLPAPPDRTLQNIAYGAAAGLLGIAVIAVIGRLAWRRTAAERSRKTTHR